MSKAFNTLKAIKVERLFRIDPRFESQKRAMGMHLWYEVIIDDTADMNAALHLLSKVPGIVEAEYEPEMQMLSDNTPASYSLMDYQNRTAEMPFSDPLLAQQWHYNNTGASNIS